MVLKEARDCSTIHSRGIIYYTNTIVNEALWLKKILYDIYMEQKNSIEIFVDNYTIITISHHPMFHEKLRISTSNSTF